MEFYEAVRCRRTAREFTDQDVPLEIVQNILNAGLKAPTNDHMRNWEFILFRSKEEKENGLQFVKAWAEAQKENKLRGDSDSAKQMYSYAMPRQYTMLAGAPWVILPFFKAADGVFHPTSVSSLNSFASIWCVIENIFLAAAAEGLGCSVRIPVGEEGKNVALTVKAPEGYVLPCYIGLGHPVKAEAFKQNEYSAADKTHYGIW